MITYLAQRFSLLLMSVLVVASPCAAATGKPVRPPNVLFIAVDDLRPELGCYGSSFIKTPNIDRLASSAVVFDRHYVQFAVCIPSRAALLTSLSPERTHQNYGPTVWNKVEGVQPWGRTFQLNGYEAVSLGKIWHVEGDSPDTFDLVGKIEGRHYGDPKNDAIYAQWRETSKKTGAAKNPEPKAPIAEAFDAPDSEYIDGALADDAIVQLDRLKKGDKPFMLAVGFSKPHLPFAAPKRYWDLYDPEKLPLAPNPSFPVGMPAIAWSGNPNFEAYDYDAYERLPKGSLNDQVMPIATARWLRHGYFACVSFTDAQVGRVLAALEKNGLAENTIVVLWGDHGFHLGDLNLWGKQTNFEEAARSPLIVRAPGRTKAGQHSTSIIQTVDILPTLVDLCGMKPLPLTDGKSFSSVVADPTQVTNAAAFHVFDRNPARSASDTRPAKDRQVIGHAIRTPDYRLVDWRESWSLSGERVAIELYDYAKDPLETKNVVDDPAYAEIRAQLEEQLRCGPASLNP